MRRFLLMTGVAMGTAILCSAGVLLFPSKDERIEAHFDKVRDIAFCQKGYEIASSFPSYKSYYVADMIVKAGLLAQADTLEAKSKLLDHMLYNDLKDEAKELGLTGKAYEQKLESIKTKAELQAVRAFQQADQPLEVIGKLDEVCQTHISE